MVNSFSPPIQKTCFSQAAVLPMGLEEQKIPSGALGFPGPISSLINSLGGLI